MSQRCPRTSNEVLRGSEGLRSLKTLVALSLHCNVLLTCRPATSFGRRVFCLWSDSAQDCWSSGLPVLWSHGLVGLSHCCSPGRLGAGSHLPRTILFANAPRTTPFHPPSGIILVAHGRGRPDLQIVDPVPNPPATPSPARVTP